MLRGLVTNDRFDPARSGSDATLQALSEARADARRASRSGRGRRRASVRRARGALVASERSMNPARRPRCLRWAEVLMDRYGVLTREVVALEPSAPSWAQLAPLLSRAEWRGEIRRGYFVEGLSACNMPRSRRRPSSLGRPPSGGLSTPSEPARRIGDPMRRNWSQISGSSLAVVCAADPANIYGSGAPLDIELLEGGVARLPRSEREFPGRARRPARLDHRVAGKAIDRASLGRARRARSGTRVLAGRHGKGRKDPQGRNVQWRAGRRKRRLQADSVSLDSFATTPE